MGRRVLAAIFLFVVLDAMALQARGPLLASFETEFGVSPGLLGLVAPAGTVGFVGAVLAVGFLAGRVSLQRVLFVGALSTAVSLLLMGIAPIYWVFLAALFAQGTAVGVFRGGDRVVLSHLFPAERGRMFMLHALAWAVGAVSGPLVVSRVLQATDWRVTFLLFAAGVTPVSVLLWRRIDLTDLAAEQPLTRDALRRVLATPEVLGAGGALWLAGGIEGTIFTWLPYYAGTFLPRGAANGTLSVFLLGYVPGRVAYSYLLERTSVLALATAVTSLLGPLLWVALDGRAGLSLVVTVFGAGVLVSGLFPTLSAYGVEAVPEFSGPVSALATAGAYLGLATVPLVVGVLAEHTSIGLAIQVPVWLSVVLFAWLVWMWVWSGPVRSG